MLYSLIINKLNKWLRGSCFILATGVVTMAVGTDADDVLIEPNTSSGYLYAEKGNDVAIYQPRNNRNKVDYFDGGQGLDTLWLRVSLDEYHQPAFKADVIRAFYFFQNHSNRGRQDNAAKSFRFHSTGLTIRNFEHLIVEQIEPEQKALSEVETQDSFRLKDTHDDSLALNVTFSSAC